MTRRWHWWWIVLLTFAALGCSAAGDDDDDEVVDDDADDDAVDDDDDDVVDDDTADDDMADDDAIDDDMADDDAVDDDTTDDDAVDDDTVDDDTVDDDTADDDTIDDDTADDDTIEFEYSIKTNNMAFADVQSNLHYLAERNMTLYLCVAPYEVGPDLTNLLTAAREQGVTVRLWPLLNGEDGAWGNEDNLDTFIANVWTTLDYANTVENSIDTIVLNLELGHPKIDLFRQYFAEGDWAAALQLVLGNRDRDMFAQSLLKLQALLDDLHEQGYAVQATSYPFLLDDFTDGDPDLQDVCNVPLQDLPFDIWSFTPYTTAYTIDLGTPIGPYFVYSYGRQGCERFGAATEVSVGIVPMEGEQGYTSFAQFTADIAAAKAAGVRHIAAFHLPGFLAQDDPAAWLDAMMDTPPAEPPVEATVELIHLGVGLADGILDFVP